MSTETNDENKGGEPDPKILVEKDLFKEFVKAKPEDDTAKLEADKAAAAEKAKADKAIAKAVEKAKADAIAEYKAQAEKDAKEAADLATKSETEKAQAAAKKLQDKLDAALADAADSKLTASLALELIEQSLQPASPKAREHIIASFKAHVAAGKSPDDALKAVHVEEAYLFKAPAPQIEQPKLAAKTQPSTKGATVSPADFNAGKGDKAPGDMSAVELREHVRTRLGVTIN